MRSCLVSFRFVYFLSVSLRVAAVCGRAGNGERVRGERIDSLSLSLSASGAIALTDRKSGSHLVSDVRSVQSCAIAGFLGELPDRSVGSVLRCVSFRLGYLQTKAFERN